MYSEKYINFSNEDFIMDDDFQEWLNHPNQDNSKFWNDFIRDNPEKKEQIKEAAFFVKMLRALEPVIPEKNKEKLFEQLKPFLYLSRKRKIWQRLAKQAAILLFLISIGGLIYYFINSENFFPMELASAELLEKGKIILDNRTVAEFETEETQIQQTYSGALTINNDTVNIVESLIQSEKSVLTQVIMPYGKRSEIILSDETRIWLNSGSQLSYPAKFTGNTREVYLSGEAFFEVESDPARPFHVITEDMKIRATGTKFNVTSYANDNQSQVVLLSGKVDASKNKRLTTSYEIEPGERIIYNKQDDKIQKEKVDTELYASWINGYLIFENEPVENIFKKLERYYNKNILTGKNSGNSTFTGKLDLADCLEKVLENIGFSASFSVKTENGMYIILQ